MEMFILTEGTNRIEVRGAGRAYGLFLDGKSFVYYWPDCAGSIGHDLYRFATQAESATPLSLAEITAQEPHAQKSLAELIRPLLRLFPAGSYTLTLSSLNEADAWDDYSIGNGNETTDFDQYPYAWDYPDRGQRLITTQPYDRLDTGRILHFWYAIEQGERPFAITASIADAKCEFVLDGHHKLMAYTYAGIPAWRLCISANGPKPLSAADWPTTTPLMPSWTAYHEYQHSLTEEQRQAMDAAQSYYDWWVCAPRE